MYRVFCILLTLITLSSCAGYNEMIHDGSLPRNQFGYVNFNLALESGRPVIAKFGLEFSAGCQEVNQLLISLMPLYQDKVYFSSVDLMEDRVSEDLYHLTVMPTILFFDATGMEIYRIEGLATKEKVVEVLDDMIGSNTNE